MMYAYSDSEHLCGGFYAFSNKINIIRVDAVNRASIHCGLCGHCDRNTAIHRRRMSTKDYISSQCSAARFMLLHIMFTESRLEI